MSEWSVATQFWAITGSIAAALIASIAALIAIGVVIFKVGRWTGVINTSLETFKGTITKIQEDIKDAVREIKEAVTKTQADINSLQLELTSKTLSPGSPLEPNELGKKVSETIGVPSIVKGLAVGLSEKAEGKHPYDIQELCFNFVRDDYDPSDEVEKNIKEFAYENGISRADVMDVLAVELRDEILRLIGHRE